MTSRSDRNYVPLNEEEQKIMDHKRGVDRWRIACRYVKGKGFGEGL